MVQFSLLRRHLYCPVLENDQCNRRKMRCLRRRFEGTFCLFHRRFIDIVIGTKKNYKNNAPRFKMDFLLNFAMCSADFASF